MNWLLMMSRNFRQLTALLAVLFTLVAPAQAQDTGDTGNSGSRSAAGSHRTLSNIAYITGNRAGLQATHQWTSADVVYRKATFPLGKNTGSGNLDSVVSQTMEDWAQCNLRYGVEMCRVMVGCEEDETAFVSAPSGQASARGGLSASRCGAAVDQMISQDSGVRHNIRLSYLGTSRGGVKDESARHVELWILPPDVGVDFAGMGYRDQVSDLDAAMRLEAIYAARNLPDANMFVGGFLLNLQSSKGPAWVTIPVNGLPTLGKGPIPEGCDLELENPMTRSQMAATVTGNAMPTGGEQVTLTYVRERWVEIASCPSWVPVTTGSDVSVGGDTFIWDLSTGECRKPAHDEEGTITPEGVLELEIALRKEKQFRADSEGFARHIVALSSQDGFWLEGDYTSTGYMRVHFDGLCAIDMHNAQVAARKEEARLKAEEIAARKAELVKIDGWYNKPGRFFLAFDGLVGTDILLTNPNPYSASAAFVGGGMLKIGGSFGNDLHRLVPFAIAIPQWHGGTEFYANAPAGLGFGGGLAYQGGTRGDVGGSIGGGYYHSMSMWTDAAGDRFDDLDDTAFTELNLLVHPRGEFLGYVDGRSVYAGGARKGSLVLGLHTAVSFRSGMEPGSMMTLAQVKGVIGFEY